MTGTNIERFNRARAMLKTGPISNVSMDHIVLSLGYVLASPDAHTAIVGARNLKHLLANIKVVEISLSISERVGMEINKRFDLIGKGWCAID